MASYRDRIKSLRRVPASEITANHLNYRKHPDSQRNLMKGLLESVGFVGALLCREDDKGKLHLIDGHLRQDISGDEKVPVLVLDVTEEESHVVLATYDPISAQAEISRLAMNELLQVAESDHPVVDDYLREMKDITDEEIEGINLTAVGAKPPPQMVWAIVGIPLPRWVEISGLIEQLSDIDGIFIEVTASDQKPPEENR